MNQNNIARIISTLFVPPSFSLIVYAVYSIYVEQNSTSGLRLFMITTLFGFVFPILMFVIMRKRNLVSDQDALIKEQRTIPFIVATLIYLIGLLILVYFEVSIISISFWFCFISNTLLTILINKYWKISIHAMGASGGFAALFFAFGVNVLPFVILVLLVGWSRIVLKCHTPSQVLAGILLSFFSVYFQMYLITNYFY